jgi:hypothetical protein
VPLKLFFKLGAAFESYSMDAAWDDLRLGLKQPLSFSKCALVTDIEWLRRGSKIMGPLMPMQLMVFHLNDEGAATAWIKTDARSIKKVDRLGRSQSHRTP